MVHTINGWDTYEVHTGRARKCAETGRIIARCETHLYDKPSGSAYCRESDTYTHWKRGASQK